MPGGAYQLGQISMRDWLVRHKEPYNRQVSHETTRMCPSDYLPLVSDLPQVKEENDQAANFEKLHE